MEIMYLHTLTLLVFFILGAGICFITWKLFISLKSKKLPITDYFLSRFFLAGALLTFLFTLFGISIPAPSNNMSQGANIVFVLDVSKSMNTIDMETEKYNFSRLDISKNSIAKFIQTHPNNRYGLVIFAGDAIASVPLTSDHQLFLQFLKNVDYKNIATQGSNFKKAFELGNDRLIYAPDASTALIFISDGGDSQDEIGIGYFRDKKDSSVSYMVVGVGSEKGGNILLGTDNFGDPVFQTYKGKRVVSQKNTSYLSSIADSLGGAYIDLTNEDDVQKFDTVLHRLEKQIFQTNNYTNFIDLSRYIAFISFFCFLLSLVFSYRTGALYTK